MDSPFCEDCGDEFAKDVLKQIQHFNKVESAQIDSVEILNREGEGAMVSTQVSIKLPVAVWGICGDGINSCLRCGKV
jgi:hypothetical protein